MRNRNLIFSLVASSLFMPSIEALERTTDLNSLENENNIYEAVDILIAEGGGSGAMTPAEKKKRKERQQKAKDAAKKRNEKKESNSNKANVDSYQALIKLREERSKSNPDDLFAFLDDEADLDIIISFFDVDKIYQQGFTDYKGDYEKNRGLFDISEDQKKEFRENDNDANEYGSDAGNYIQKAIAMKVFELGKKYEEIYQQTLKALKNKNLQLSPSLKDEIVAKYKKTALYLNGLFIMVNQGSALLDEESGKWYQKKYNNSQEGG